jgi:hypothetical protein
VADKPEIRYGDYYDAASRFTTNEAWVLNKKENKWNRINTAEHGQEVRELSKANWDKEFPNAPPLPPEAFKA